VPQTALTKIDEEGNPVYKDPETCQEPVTDVTADPGENVPQTVLTPYDDGGPLKADQPEAIHDRVEAESKEVAAEKVKAALESSAVPKASKTLAKTVSTPPKEASS